MKMEFLGQTFTFIAFGRGISQLHLQVNNTLTDHNSIYNKRDSASIYK